MRELVARPHREYPRFGVALSLLSIVEPAEAVTLLARRLEALDGEIKELNESRGKATDKGVPWVFLIEDDHELGQLDAERRFVTNLIERLQQPDYVRAWKEFFERES
jgi:hypothetical protein